MTVAEQVERIFRAEHGRVLAALISQFEDFDLAEDALQEALVNALERWEGDGIPANPGAWLTTVARRRAIDRMRRSAALERSLPVLDPQLSYDEHEMDETQIPDDRLKLIFTCCHPSLALEAQVALTLHTLGGLSTPEVARAFLTSLHFYLRLKRLWSARCSLALGLPGLSIKRAAVANGFWHMGEFSRLYKAVFGELPSQTLMRSRRL